MFESPVPMQILASMVFIQNCFSLDKEHFRAETCRARNKVLFNFNLCVCRDFTKYLSRETFGQRIFREISFKLLIVFDEISWKKTLGEINIVFSFFLYKKIPIYRYCPSILCTKDLLQKFAKWISIICVETVTTTHTFAFVISTWTGEYTSLEIVISRYITHGPDKQQDFFFLNFFVLKRK